MEKATFSGYGQLGVLPSSGLCRDNIESIIAQKTIKSEVKKLLEYFLFNQKENASIKICKLTQ